MENRRLFSRVNCDLPLLLKLSDRSEASTTLLIVAPQQAYEPSDLAAYGGVYVAASLLWLWIVEGTTPDRWDFVGGAVVLAGAAIILFGPRG